MGNELADYAVRSETRHEHLAELRRLYGFRSFAGGAAHELGDRLREEAPRAQSNEDLVRRFVEACRHTRTILPATTTIERICADALVDAERRIEARIAERVPPGLRRDLEYLLEETVDAGVTRFVWLRDPMGVDRRTVTLGCSCGGSQPPQAAGVLMRTETSHEAREDQRKSPIGR